MTQRHAHRSELTRPRSPRLTTALTASIARGVRARGSLGEAARARGVTRETAYEWLKRGAIEVESEAGPRSRFGHFCAAVRQARAQFAERILRTINRYVHAERPTKAIAARARTAMASLEERFPTHWGRLRPGARVTITVNLGALSGSGPQMAAPRRG